MPKITFLPGNKTVEYKAGQLPYRGEGERESLLDVALNHRIAVRHACGGICACTTCHVFVKQGDDRLSAMEKDEQDRLYRVRDFTLHSRLACRAVVRADVRGDIVVRLPASNGEPEGR